jgi:hypothetical protein
VVYHFLRWIYTMLACFSAGGGGVACCGRVTLTMCPAGTPGGTGNVTSAPALGYPWVDARCEMLGFRV